MKSISFIVSGIWVALSFAIPAAGAEAVPQTFSFTGQALVDARQGYRLKDPAVVAAVNSLKKEADEELSDGPFTVVNKKHPIEGIDPHDYVSLAVYFWPNPDTANKLPYVRHDGKRNPELKDYDAVPFSDFSDHVRVLSLVGYLTGEQKYSDRAALLIRAWLFDPATAMNPNFEHAQLVKGVNLGRGTGLIEALRFLPVLDAIGMLHGTSSWSEEDQHKAVEWFTKFVTWMRASANGKDEAAAANNHGSWYDAQATAYLLFVGDTESARQLVEQAKTKRIARQIEPDGSEPLEQDRTLSLHYSAYCLNALSLLAELGQRVDVDLWGYKTSDGRCMKAALDFLIPYATGDKKWEHEQISNFNPQALFVTLRRAAVVYKSAKYQQLSDQFGPEGSKLDLFLYPGFKP